MPLLLSLGPEMPLSALVPRLEDHSSWRMSRSGGFDGSLAVVLLKEKLILFYAVNMDAAFTRMLLEGDYMRLICCRGEERTVMMRSGVSMEDERRLP